MTIGIIGAGSFGLFLAEKLTSHATVKVYSRSNKGGEWNASLEEVAGCDWLVPSVPLHAYEQALTACKPHVRPDTVIVDICSVKVAPMELLAQIFPNNPRVATHPLFGPESAADSLEGHVMVLCAELSDDTAYTQVKKFSEQLKLRVVEMSAVEHDREMAVVQGLTFFIARALKDMHLHHMQLETPSFKRLLHLGQLEENHSQELFETIQKGNAATAGIRQQFIDNATKINQELQD